MKIGKLLKEKYGFDSLVTRTRFICKYHYTNKWLADMLDDKFPELLPAHLLDIVEFTGIPMEDLLKLQGVNPNKGPLREGMPLGKPFCCLPIKGVVKIKDIKEAMKGPTPVIDVKDLSHATGLTKSEIQKHMEGDGKTISVPITDLSDIMEMPLIQRSGSVFSALISDYLNEKPLKQGIIGIQVDSMINCKDLDMVQQSLFDIPGETNYDLQIVIVPPPLIGVFFASSEKDVKAIGGRVQRDRTDGIRYNRLYVALYWDDLGKSNIEHHDVFFDVTITPTGAVETVITDNRKEQ